MTDLDLTVLLIVIGVAALGVVLAVMVLVVMREIRKTRTFFTELAKRYGGRVMRFPAGVVFRLGYNAEVRIHVLQGSVLYRARLRLPEDPGILVMRIYRRFKWLDKLSYSPGRTRYRLNGPVDEQYSFQAFDPVLLRKVFAGDILDRLATQGRVTRIEIRKTRFKGALMMLSFSAAEVERGHHSVEILNEVLQRVLR
jgi:hypothetical protein